MIINKKYEFTIEDRPGPAWAARFAAGRAEALRWYLGKGRGPAPDPGECRAALARFMPALLPHYDDACRLIGDDRLGHGILSHWRPGPVAEGCSQAVWLGAGGPALVRNYDFPLAVVTGRIECTCWNGTAVIGKAQRPWGGLIDGMNARGLVASLTAGGGPGQGPGFAVILMLRHVLEDCATVAEAAAVLAGIPIAQSQNVTLLDRHGDHATLFLGPGRAAGVSPLPVCTNHQEGVGPDPSPAARHSLLRQERLLAALDEPGMTLDGLVDRFLAPPVYSRRAASTTAYTAVYRPADGSVDYIWPGRRVRQRFGGFVECEYTHDYGELDP